MREYTDKQIQELILKRFHCVGDYTAEYFFAAVDAEGIKMKRNYQPTEKERREVISSIASQIVDFYHSDAWREVRYHALKMHGGCCQCCGMRAGAGKPLHVDHIKPRSKYPELELDLSNLQVLCEDCNLGKRAGDETDWRSPSDLANEIAQAESSGGGWTKEQLAKWGVSWPPPKGWRLAGKCHAG